jgi:hypothetical protein
VSGDSETTGAQPSVKAGGRPRTSVIALVTALLALVSGAVGLAFDLHPEWRPDPRNESAASVTVFADEPGVPVDDWLRRTSPNGAVYRARRQADLSRAFKNPRDATPAQLASVLGVPGELFYVRTTVKGFKRRSLSLRWSTYDWRTRKRVAGADKRDVAAADFTLDAPSDSSVALVWTPRMAQPGWYFARFEIVAPDGTVLAVADSPKFAALSTS